MVKQGTATVTVTLTPKLRFPAFRAAPGWCVKRMDRLYSFMRNNVLSRDKLNYEAGLAKNIHYGDIHTKFSALFDVTKERIPFVNDTEEVPAAGCEDYCIEGDIIFADASEDTNDVGKSMEIVRLNGEPVLSGQHTILARRKDESLIVGFGGYLFRSGLMRSRIKKEAQGTKVYQVSSSRLGGIEITYPSDTAEQQKIADCLTSLDEVIAAQGRKVGALKAHKRGLMQQLFPREGESRPRLRFLEFRNAKEWGSDKLQAFLGISATYGIVKAGDFQPEGVPMLRGGDIKDGCIGNGLPLVTEEIHSQYKRTRLQANDVVIALVGYPGEAAVIPDHYVGANISRAVGLLRVKAKLSASFLACFLNSPVGRRTVLKPSAGSAQVVVNLKQLNDLVIPVPPLAEQQRIAGCFSSLDTQITAESNQLATLKTHKQGLMQQLFPAPERGA